MNLSDEDLDSEIDQKHFGWFLDCGTLAACAIAVAISPVEMKIRQMAVRTASQRSGHGRKLTTMIEGQLAISGTRTLLLHARPR
jgi:N-acetylglutamate synthase-like GNAT family acetyltransferase